jgi:hypothetical protein
MQGEDHGPAVHAVRGANAAVRLKPVRDVVVDARRLRVIINGERFVLGTALFQSLGCHAVV